MTAYASDEFVKARRKKQYSKKDVNDETAFNINRTKQRHSNTTSI